jgi:hypothetical protein
MNHFPTPTPTSPIKGGGNFSLFMKPSALHPELSETPSRPPPKIKPGRESQPDQANLKSQRGAGDRQENDRGRGCSREIPGRELGRNPENRLRTRLPPTAGARPEMACHSMPPREISMPFLFSISIQAQKQLYFNFFYVFMFLS